MKRILITGITGEVGALLAQGLLAQGHQITALTRVHPHLSPTERVAKALKQETLRQETQAPDNPVTILVGDIRQPYCGLEQDDVTHHHGNYDMLIHSAASTKFDAHLEDDTMQANVGGTRHALQLASRLAIPHFHYISTAYVAGSQAIFHEHEAGNPAYARNPYERSKQRAEQYVRQWNNGHHYIHRLSAVIGDSTTGETQHYKSFYGYLKTFWQLQKRLKPLAQEQPFLVAMNPTATLNLIPRDWMQQTMLQLFNQPIPQGSYHITHPAPRSFAWLIANALSIFDIPVHIVPLTDFENTRRHHKTQEASAAWQKMQQRLEGILLRYAPYLQREPVFTTDNIQQVLGQAYQPPPTIDGELMQRLLDYAIADNFGTHR